MLLGNSNCFLGLQNEGGGDRLWGLKIICFHGNICWFIDASGHNVKLKQVKIDDCGNNEGLHDSFFGI